MSMIDYGALLRVDGKFINKNCGLFMNASNTGYVCKRAINNDGKEYVIGNMKRVATHANMDDSVMHWTLQLKECEGNIIR